MEHFKTQVKLFVLNERAQGKGWKVIKERITQRFNINPPTTRAMQKWEQKLDRTALNKELLKSAKAQMPVFEAEAQVQLAQELLPMLWRAKDSGQDVELAGFEWFLHFIESRLGSQRFEQLINRYMGERRNASLGETEEGKK